MFVRTEMTDRFKFKLGFTLIELLVVISVIGLLMGFGMAKYSTAEKQARDTQRQSDLNQYRVALENYAAASSSLYPNPTTSCGSVDATGGLCSLVIGSQTFEDVYLSGICLQDPKFDATYFYRYCVGGSGSQYILWALLESGKYYEICSNGKSGQTTIAPTGSTCNL